MKHFVLVNCLNFVSRPVELQTDLTFQLDQLENASYKHFITGNSGRSSLTKG